MHLVAAEVSLFDGTPNNSQVSPVSTLTSGQESTPTPNNSQVSPVPTFTSGQESTPTREESVSTLTNLIETNPGLIVSPDETGITPLHIMSRNLFSGVSSLTISQNVDMSPSNSDTSPPTPSKHFEQSKEILSKMIHTALPPDADEDFLNHLFIVTGSLKDLQGNNPLHELMTSFGSSRMSSLTALTDVMHMEELTAPNVAVPELQPMFYELGPAVDGAVSDTLSISFLEQDTRTSLLLVNESPVLPDTRQSLLLIDKSKSTTIHVTHSSQKKISIPSISEESKDSGIDEQFAKDFFTGESSDFSSVSDFLKDVMQTTNGVSLPFAEFKNQTNAQGYYPIDTLIDFMTTFDWYLVNNFKFKTATPEQKSAVAMKPRLNVTAPPELGILFSWLIPEDEQGNPVKTEFVEEFKMAGDGKLQSIVLADKAKNKLQPNQQPALHATVGKTLTQDVMYDVIEGKFSIDVNGTVSFPEQKEFVGKPDAYFQGTRVYINRYMNSIIKYEKQNGYSYIENDNNNNKALINYLRDQINPVPSQPYQFKIAFTKYNDDSWAHFICIEHESEP